MSKYFLFLTMLTALAFSTPLHAENYDIDIEHAVVQFKIKHLGYSWLVGRFNKFDGNFSYDEKNPAASKIEVTIETASIDSNHAERDKHIRSKDFLNVSKFPTAKFVSRSFSENGNGKAQLVGDFTLHGVTKKITFEIEHVGHGSDPWGGYRRGFSGSTILTLRDYGITTDLGPASREVEMFFSIEGVRKK